MGVPPRATRRFGVIMILAALLVVGVAPLAAHATSPGGSNATPGEADPTPVPAHRQFYLALGDSVPIWNGVRSYPNLILAHYIGTTPNLKLVNMACSDETTSSMLSGSKCAPGGSQQDDAVAFLRRHRGSTALVTIDIGGNDVVHCGGPSGLNKRCVERAEKAMLQNLRTILSGLRDAAGPTVPIVSMSYYDPFLGDWLAGGATRSVALQTVPILVHLNNLLKKTYSEARDRIADVQGAFKTTDVTHMVASPWGQVPVAVDKACTLLDIRCHIGKPEGFGDDPNPHGAIVIAKAFEAVIGSLSAGQPWLGLRRRIIRLVAFPSTISPRWPARLRTSSPWTFQDGENRPGAVPAHRDRPGTSRFLDHKRPAAWIRRKA